jgi:hypothetical protein
MKRNALSRYALSGLTATALSLLGQPVSAADFACHVIIQGAKPAIVYIEIETRHEARSMAAAVRARAADGTRGPVTEVVQCIDRHTEQFRDPGARTLLEERGL